MTKYQQRTMQIIEMLRANTTLPVSAVADTLGISQATVRRLFTELEKDGKVIRIHGGVRIAPEVDFRYSFGQSTQHRVREKAAIGEAAAEYVENGDSVFLDSGTTVLRFAEVLAVRLQYKSITDIVVVTNSLNVADVLGDFCRVIVIGGEVRLQRRDVNGSLALKYLSQFQIRKAFVGVDGISIKNGLMTTDAETAQLNELTIERASESYVLADSEKFNRNSFIRYAPITAVKLIITDNELDRHTLNAFTGAGAPIRAVPVDSP